MQIRLPRDPEFYAKNVTRIVMLAASITLPIVNGSIDNMAAVQAKQTAVLDAIEAKLADQDKKIALIEAGAASDRAAIKEKFEAVRNDMSWLRDKIVDFIRRSELQTKPPSLSSGGPLSGQL